MRDYEMPIAVPIHGLINTGSLAPLKIVKSQPPITLNSLISIVASYIVASQFLCVFGSFLYFSFLKNLYFF